MKHRRTKATDIPKWVRQDVAIRDSGNCIICGRQGQPNAHYIARSQGGLGIPENIVTLCLGCHHDYDNGSKHIEYGQTIENYLKAYYGDSWNKDKLIYKKYKGGNYEYTKRR